MKKKTPTHSQFPLKFRGKYHGRVQEIIDKLHKIPRTGYADRGVENPETVGEHTDDCVRLAQKFFHISGLTTMIKIHNWRKSDKNVGDRRTDPLCPPEKRWTKEQKYEAELKAMTKICSKLGPKGRHLLKLWLEFEAGKTFRANKAQQVDKCQTIKKSIKYEEDGAPVIAQEFIDYYGPIIKDIKLRISICHDSWNGLSTILEDHSELRASER